MPSSSSPESLDHDLLVDRLLEEAALADKARLASQFLAGLDGDFSLCAALPVYASLKNFPRHTHTIARVNAHLDVGLVPCEICCDYRKVLYIDEAYYAGRLQSASLDSLLYGKWYTLRHARLNHPVIQPSTTSLAIFQEILHTLANAGPDQTIRDVHKTLKKAPFAKGWAQSEKKRRLECGESLEGVASEVAEHLQAILETLGYCGILASSKHRGPFHEYKSNAQVPRTSRSSDWAYPVDFWTGQDGVDQEALDYWFREALAMKHQG